MPTMDLGRAVARAVRGARSAFSGLGKPTNTGGALGGAGGGKIGSGAGAAGPGASKTATPNPSAGGRYGMSKTDLGRVTDKARPGGTDYSGKDA